MREDVRRELTEVTSSPHRFLQCSTHTFTGTLRNLTLPPSPHPLPASLQPFASKMVIHPHPGRPLAHPSEDPFVLEREQRATVTDVINAEIARRGHKGETVVVMGDVDEIPRRETVGILRECAWEGGEAGNELRRGADVGWGKMHLQLRQYLYSFEFPTVSRSIPPSNRSDEAALEL